MESDALTRHVLVAVCMVAALSAGCTSTPRPTYKLYGGAERPEAAIAKIVMHDAAAAEVDGRAFSASDYGAATVLPGPHTVRWQCVYGVSVMIEPTGWATREGSAGLMLEPGHAYSLHCDRTTGYGYETFQGIRDDTAARDVAGERKP